MFYKGGSSNTVYFFMQDADGLPVTGLTLSITVVKDAGSSAAAAGTQAEIGNGRYRYTPTSGESTADSILFLATGTGAIDCPAYIYPSDLTATWAANLTQIGGVANASATLPLAALDVGAVTWDSLSIVNPAGAAVTLAGSTDTINITHTGTGYPLLINHAPSVPSTKQAVFIVTSANVMASTVRIDSENGNAVRLVGNGSGFALMAENGISIGGGLEVDTITNTDWGGVNVPVVLDALPTLAEMLSGGVALEATSQDIYADTQAILAALGSAIVYVTNPVSETGIELVQGDSYTTAAGRALVWTIEDYTGPSVAGGTLTFGVVTSSSYGTPTATTPSLGPITGVAAMVGDDLVMTVELTAAQTATLSSGYPAGCSPYQYQLLLTTAGSLKITEQFGPVEVLKKII